jgi:hypothetical protein
MKIGFVSESPADDAAIQILLEAISGREIEPISRARVRAGGWPSMLQAIQVEYTRLYYHTDAHAIIAVADSDDSAIHEIAHGSSNSDFENCRFCLLSERLRHTRSRLRPRPDGHQVHSAIGLAVPALEAWLLCGSDRHCVEDRFVRELQDGRSLAPLRRQLKAQLYGTITPPLSLEIEIATREARRLARDLSLLETHFPRGFLPFAQQVRAW